MRKITVEDMELANEAIRSAIMEAEALGIVGVAPEVAIVAAWDQLCLEIPDRECLAGALWLSVLQGAGVVDHVEYAP